MDVKCFSPWGTALVLLLLLFSCSGRNDADSKAVLHERFLDRVAALEGNLLRKCREDVLEEAMAQADSLLIDRARRLSRIEGRPPRPNRPGTPEIKVLSSPLPLRPLFPFEIRFDTLLRDSLYQDSLRLDSIDRRELLLQEL